MRKALTFPTPSSINMFWNLGFLLTLTTGLQIITGMLLGFFYDNVAETSFDSIALSTRNSIEVYILKAAHSTFPTFIFALMYIHMYRGIYYKSYMYHPLLWLSGNLLLFMYMIISFLGYTLPWGQMSFWGATVITNFLTSIPYFGELLKEWVIGDFAVSDVALKRFQTLHYLLPMLLLFFIMSHLFLLHQKGSSNPLMEKSNISAVPFYPYHSYKDLVAAVYMFMALSMVIFFVPNIFMDEINNVTANPMSTPVHIKPEWYFLHFYAILRSVDSKFLGVILMVLAALWPSLLAIKSYIPSLGSGAKTNSYLTFYLITIHAMLMFLGAKPAEEAYSVVLSVLVFMFFLVFFLL